MIYCVVDTRYCWQECGDNNEEEGTRRQMGIWSERELSGGVNYNLYRKRRCGIDQECSKSWGVGWEGNK